MEIEPETDADSHCIKAGDCCGKSEKRTIGMEKGTQFHHGETLSNHGIV
jgi:hypothetical protein